MFRWLHRILTINAELKAYERVADDIGISNKRAHEILDTVRRDAASLPYKIDILAEARKRLYDEAWKRDDPWRF